MAVPTAAILSDRPGRGEGGQVEETWRLTGGSGGSADGDQVAITTRFLKRPLQVIGGVSATISGGVVTAQLITALAAGETLDVRIVGFIG